MKNWVKFSALLLVFGGFGGLVWYAAVERETLAEDGKLPLVKASQTAVKVRAKNPGGMIIPNRDKKIFDLLEVTGGKAVVSKEEAQRVNCKTSEGVKSNCLQEEKSLPKVEIVRQQVAQQQVAQQQVAQKSPPKSQKHKKAAEVVEVIAQHNDNKIEIVNGKTADGKISSSTITKPPQAKLEKPAKNSYSLTKKSAKTVTTSGKWGVQLGSYRSVSEANKGIAIFQKKYGDLLAGLNQKVQKADLGVKGIYYRVKFFGLADKAAAKSLCAKFKAKKQGCLHVNN